MLSIIVSSRDIKLFNQLSVNIKQTVGCEYEIIRIENMNYFGICQAYNIGVSKSKYETLCFVHEDLLFHTKDWGKKICKILTDETIGVVGIAGQTYRSRVPSTWFSFYAPEKTISLNIIQHNNGIIKHQKEMIDKDLLTEVVCCDGVFLASRRDVLDKYPFDQRNFKNFHFYDLDFCLNVRKNFKVVVTQNILLEHFSQGKLDSRWLNEANIFYDKWGRFLPIDLNKFSKKQIEEIEKINQKGLFMMVFGLHTFKGFLLLFKIVPFHSIIRLLSEKLVNKLYSKQL